MASAANVCGYAAQLRSLELSSFASSSSARARGLCLSRAQLRSWPKASFGLRKCSRNVGLRVVCSLGEMKKISETQALALTENPRRLAEKLPAATGVYAMLDKNGEVQFIGLSRRISESVLGHIRDVPELCGSVKIAVVNSPRKRDVYEAWSAWMHEFMERACRIPHGNEAGDPTWSVKEIPEKQDLRLREEPFMDFDAPVQELIKRLSQQHEALAFIRGSRNAPMCSESINVLHIFREQMIDCETVDVFDDDHNRGLRKALKAYTGFPSFPQIFLQGKFVGGVDVLEQMAEKGQLYEIFHK